MEVSELRKRILRALDDARRDAVARRKEVDDAAAAFGALLETVAAPLLLQTAQVLNATGSSFSVQTPANAARLVSDKSPHTFVEFILDTSRPQLEVVGRTSIARGRDGHVTERPIAAGKPVADVTEDDLAHFLLSEVPKLIVKS